MQQSNNHRELIHTLYKIGAVQFGGFTFKSGLTSSVYINLRKMISYPSLLQSVAELMWEKIKECQFDLICGVPYTALPLAVSMSLKHNIPLIMRRKEKKDYGTKQHIEGEYQSQQRCLIIEDVVTTGSSIIETANDLKEVGLVIQDVVALVDREQGGAENLKKEYRFHSILSLSTILKTLLESNLLNEKERHSIDEFLLKRSA